MTSERSGLGGDWSAALAIIVMYMIANYLLVGGFGLYEDDWIYLGHGFNEPPQAARVIADIVTFPQGRPIQHTMMHFGEWFLHMSQSVAALYLITGLVSAFGLFLWYCVLRPRFGARDALLITTLTVFSPLHTVAQFLNGALSFAPALVLLMTAMLLYRSADRRLSLASYPVASLVLLAYEPYFLLFALAPWFAAPLLSVGWRARAVRFALHGLIVLAILLLYAALREVLGARPLTEATGEASMIDSAPQIVLGAFSGATQSLGVFAYVANVQWYNPAIVATGVSIFLLAAAALVAALPRPEAPSGPKPLASILDEVLLALAALVVGYATFHLLAGSSLIHFDGRSSRMSVAAVFGFAMLVVVAFRLVARVAAGAGGVRLAAATPLALTLLVMPALAVNRAKVQHDYVSMWSDIKERFRQAIALTPDATARTAIIVEMRDYGFFYPPRAMGQEPQGWPFMVETLLEGSAPLRGKPPIQMTQQPHIAYSIAEDWQNDLERLPNGRLGWTAAHPLPWPPMEHDAGNIIALRRTDSQNWERPGVQKYFENLPLVRLPPEDPLALGFWDEARPSRAMQGLMPDVAAWLLWRQQERARQRGARAEADNL